MPTLDPCLKRTGLWGDRSCPELTVHGHCRNCHVFQSAAAILLNRPAPEGYREEWRARIAHPRVCKEPGSLSLVLFRIGGDWLALAASAFLEIADLRPIRSLPHRRSEALLGLVNIRGELLLCVSLPTLLDFEPSPAPIASAPLKVTAAGGGLPPRLLVLTHRNHRTVFVADEVHVGHRCHPGELRPVPATVSLAAASHMEGVITWKGINVGVLDRNLLFNTLDRALA